MENIERNMKQTWSRQQTPCAWRDSVSELWNVQFNPVGLQWFSEQKFFQQNSSNIDTRCGYDRNAHKCRTSFITFISNGFHRKSGPHIQISNVTKKIKCTCIKRYYRQCLSDTTTNTDTTVFAKITTEKNQISSMRQMGECVRNERQNRIRTQKNHRKKRKTLKWHMRKGFRSTWEKKNATNVYCVFFYSQIHTEIGNKTQQEKTKTKLSKASRYACHPRMQRKWNKQKAVFAAVNLWRKWNIVRLLSHQAFACWSHTPYPNGPECFILR